MEDSINDVIVSHNTIWDNPAKQLLLIYGIGVLVLLVRIAIGILRLVKLHRSSYSSGEKGIRILRGGGDAFTFGTTVYLSQSVYDSYDAEVILSHERAHAQQWHTFDALLAEVARAIFWFHPMVWWLREQVQLNLEYLADAAVLAQGYDKRDYQLSLVAHQQGVDFRTSLLPQFAAKGLKRRIQMMGFRAGSQVRSLVVTGGLIFFAFLAFAVTNGKAQSVVEGNAEPRLRAPIKTDLINPSKDKLYEYYVYFKRLPSPAELAAIRQELRHFYNLDFYVYQDCLDPEGTFTFALGTASKALHQVKIRQGARTELPQSFHVSKDINDVVSTEVYGPQPLPEGAADGDIVFNMSQEWLSLSLNPGRPFTADNLTAAPIEAAIKCQLGLSPENIDDYDVTVRSLDEYGERNEYGARGFLSGLIVGISVDSAQQVIDNPSLFSTPLHQAAKYFIGEERVTDKTMVQELMQKGWNITAAARKNGPDNLVVVRLDPSSPTKE